MLITRNTQPRAPAQSDIRNCPAFGSKPLGILLDFPLSGYGSFPGDNDSATQIDTVSIIRREVSTMRTCSGMSMVMALVIGSSAATQAVAEDKQPWISLFDGKTLDGWVQKNGTATYQVQNGTILGTTKEGSPNSFLCTAKQYGDFELEFEVRVHDKLNSGVQIRSKTKSKTNVAQQANDKKAKKKKRKRKNNGVGRVFGPQVEIESSGAKGAEAGYIYGEATGRGWLTPKQRLIPHKHFKDGQWNTFRVVAVGPRIQTWINGTPVADLNDPQAFKTHPRGFIGLQVHGIKSGTGPYTVAWRNIRIRPR